MVPKNFGRQNYICSSTTLHKNLISMFCGLGVEERRRFRKKKERKKNKKGKNEENITIKNGSSVRSVQNLRTM